VRGDAYDCFFSAGPEGEGLGIEAKAAVEALNELLA
jgi:hypothetical protein